MSNNKNPHCVARVMTEGAFLSSQCSFRGRVQRDGKWYCKKHDPVAVKEKRDKRIAEINRRFEEVKGQHERAQKCAEACEGVPTHKLRKGMLKRLMEK